MLYKTNSYFRPYKINIYGLQDNFLGTLHSYEDSFLGRIKEPFLEISTDGTQKFTCSIPKYYIDPVTNQRMLNPRWEDSENGILAENTRILKIFISYSDEVKVFPLLINSLTIKRDEHFSVYKEIVADGLAFSELGKLGYKLELTHEILEADYKEDLSTTATINYWLDKVFPNEKDSTGKIIKWLTPWCYEIRMEHESLTGENLLTNKIYDTPHVNSWGLTEDGENLISQGMSDYQEKARYIDCSYSNKYNITQTIAETYEVFCSYEYKCHDNGMFVANYVDEEGNYWTGRKVVFYNRAINMENPLIISYQKNLNQISRTIDSSEIYTKMYVKPIESSVAPNGLISIADTSLNPILDDFILNFDYLYSIGNISEEQKQFINKYQTDLYKINTQLKNLSEQRIKYEILKNEEDAKVSNYIKQIESAQKTLVEYEALRDNGNIGEVIIDKNTGTPISVYFYLVDGFYQTQLVQEGIDSSSLAGYTTQRVSLTDPIFDKNNNLRDYTDSFEVEQNKDCFFIVYNEEHYPNKIITSQNNTYLKSGRAMWLTMRYVPGNYYADLCLKYKNLIDNYTNKRNYSEKTANEYTVQLNSLIKLENDKLKEKEKLNELFENYLGPALREGYWSPDSYEDPGQTVETIVYSKNGYNTNARVSMFFDTEILEGEEKGWYQNNIFDPDEKLFFNYVEVENVYKDWSKSTTSLENLIIHLQRGEKYPFPRACNDINKKYYFYLYYNGNKYYFSVYGQDDVNNYSLYFSETIQGLQVSLLQDEQIIENIPWLSEEDVAGQALTAIEISNLKMGKCLYMNAGFVFSYLQQGDKYVPIFIINDKTLYDNNYLKDLTSIAYSFNDNNIVFLGDKTAIKILNEESIIGYPRIKIHNNGVMFNSESFKIIPNNIGVDTDQAAALEEYKDYILTIDNGEPVFTLKLTQLNTLESILNYPYYIHYKITRANELLYLDALQVAYDSSRPKYSYNISIVNLPESVNNIQLGQLVQINDFTVGLRCETGYLSTIKFNLDKPQDDTLTIQDYTTKFEDLFSTIAATNEAMKQSQNLYETIAGSFMPNGEISGSVLQQTLFNNDLAFNYSKTQVEIDPTEGIILNNTIPYDNGAYGQVVLKGGGIFLSSSLDGQGNRIWSNAITPMGINASSIVSGSLDTNLIRIHSGNNLAFQWNGEGIFAYKRDENGNLTTDAYVKYSDQGLQFIKEEPDGENNCSVHLGWEGLKLSAQSGALVLTAEEGLQIFYPSTKSKPQIMALQVGRWTDSDIEGENNNCYGMRLFNSEGNKTFSVDQNGNLSITGNITAVGGQIGCLTVNEDSSLSAVVGDNRLIIDSQAIIIGPSDSAIILNSSGLTASNISASNLTVTNLTVSGTSGSNFGWIYSETRPVDVHNTLWVKPHSTVSIAESVATWATRGSRAEYAYFSSEFKNYYVSSNNPAGSMPTITFSPLADGESYNYKYTLKVPTINIQSKEDGKSKPLKEIIPHFQFIVPNHKPVDFIGEQISYVPWEMKDIIIEINSDENYFSLLNENLENIQFYFKCTGDPKYQLCINSGSAITLKGEIKDVNGESSEPVECTIYYIP